MAPGPDTRNRLLLRQLDELQFSPLSSVNSNAAAAYQFFSPDGEWVAYFAQSKLWKVSVRGGTPLPICDAPNARGGSWGSDGFIVAALDRLGALWRVSANGGKPEQLTKLDTGAGESSHRWPQILPGGEAVLFTAVASTGDPNANSIAVQSVRGGQKKILWKGGTYGRYLPSGHLVFAYQNTLYAAPMDLRNLELKGTPQPVLEGIGVADNGDSAFFDFSLSGTFVFESAHPLPKRNVLSVDSKGQTRPLISTPEAYQEGLRFSPDGTRMAAGLVGGAGSGGVLIHDLARDASMRPNVGQTIAGNPQWTPDGRYVFFTTLGLHGSGIAAIRADGAGEPIQLLDGRTLFNPFSISPDGKWIVYSERSPEGHYDLRTLPIDLTGGAPQKAGDSQPLLSTSADEGGPAISPDGRWLAYVEGQGQPGRGEVYVVPFPAGSGKWLTSAGGASGIPVWSRKGHELYYLSADRQIMAVPFTASIDTFTPAKPRLWSPLKGIDQFDLAPDGESFAVLLTQQSAEGSSDKIEVTFLINFFDELKRRVPLGR